MIKLTRVIAGKKVEFDIISLNGKTVVRDRSFKELGKKGITEMDLKNAGFGIEEVEMKKIKKKLKN